MAVKTWILAGVSIDDYILTPGHSCWKRADLVNVPDILKYSQKVIPESGIQIYENNIGVLVVLMPYSEFESIEQMNSDYYSEDKLSIYNKVYRMSLLSVNGMYSKKISDFDWVMPIIEGELNLQENRCVLQGVGTDNKAFVSLIDCSMIYTSIRQISDFIHYICNKKRLTKYQRWQLAYYQMAVQIIENPKVFLTNQEEISICNELYHCWQIDENIKAVISNINQAVVLFSFLSNYEENEEDDLLSCFLTFFGIVVGLEAIYNLFAAIFENVNQLFKLTFLALIAISVITFGVIFVQKVSKKQMEKREFRRKTNKK